MFAEERRAEIAKLLPPHVVSTALTLRAVTM